MRLIIGSYYHIAPAEIQVIIEQNRYRLWRKRFFYLTVIFVFFLNWSRKSRRQSHYFVPFFENSTCHPTSISTIIMIIIIIGSKNMLNRKSTIYEIMITCDMYIFQIIKKSRPFIPIHIDRSIDDIIALQGRYGNKADIRNI